MEKAKAQLLISGGNNPFICKEKSKSGGGVERGKRNPPCAKSIHSYQIDRSIDIFTYDFETKQNSEFSSINIYIKGRTSFLRIDFAK